MRAPHEMGCTPRLSRLRTRSPHLKVICRALLRLASHAKNFSLGTTPALKLTPVIFFSTASHETAPVVKSVSFFAVGFHNPMPIPWISSPYCVHSYRFCLSCLVYDNVQGAVEFIDYFAPSGLKEFSTVDEAKLWLNERFIRPMRRCLLMSRSPLNISKICRWIVQCPFIIVSGGKTIYQPSTICRSNSFNFYPRLRRSTF